MKKNQILILLLFYSGMTLTHANQTQDELFRSQVYAELFNQHGGDWTPFLKRPEKKNHTIDFLIERVHSPQHYLHQVSTNNQLDLAPNSILALSYFLYNSKSNSYHPKVKSFYEDYDKKFETLEPETQKLILLSYYNSRSPLGLEKLVFYLAYPEQRVAQEAARLVQSIQDQPSEEGKTSLTNDEIVFDFSQHPKVWYTTLKKIRREIEVGVKNKKILYNNRILRALNNITKIQKRNRFILPFGMSAPKIEQAKAKRNELRGKKKIDSSFRNRRKLQTKISAAELAKRLKKEREQAQVSNQFVSLADRQPASIKKEGKKKDSPDYVWYGIAVLCIFLIFSMLLGLRQKK